MTENVDTVVEFPSQKGTTVKLLEGLLDEAKEGNINGIAVVALKNNVENDDGTTEEGIQSFWACDFVNNHFFRLIGALESIKNHLLTSRAE